MTTSSGPGSAKSEPLHKVGPLVPRHHHDAMRRLARLHHRGVYAEYRAAIAGWLSRPSNARALDETVAAA